MRVLFLSLLVVALLPVQDKERLRAALGDSAPEGAWIYDDLAAGIAEASRTCKPLMVVLRCVP